MNFFNFANIKALEMKTHFTLLLLGALCFLPNCSHVADNQAGWQREIAELDKTIARSDDIAFQEESRLIDLRDRLSSASDSEEKFLVCDALLDEYLKYNLDSAFAYAHLKDTLAALCGNQAYINDAKLSLARRYLISGLYREALQEVQMADTLAAFASGSSAEYYQTLHSIYDGLTLTTKDKVLKDSYHAMEHKYQVLTRDAVRNDTKDYYTVNAGIMIENGMPEEARTMIESYLAADDVSVDDLASLHYWIAKTYEAQGLIDKALEYFASSARYHMLLPVKSPRALVNTARLMMGKRQVAKAYSYITLAYEEATESDENLCLSEIAAILPEITNEYNSIEKKNLSLLQGSVIILLLIVAVAVLILLILRKYHRKIRTMNASLEDSVHRLKEANEIKDICLGRYLSQFSSQISSLERYRSSLRVTAKSRDINDILQALKSDDFIDNERALLYEEFDKTFLSAFPDFVNQLNSLLREDERIGQHLKEGRLNNELRIFALIRLGVSESSKIASFLKKSPSTVYNYRVKLRNAAVCGNDEFEKRLMEIN